jgi:uncharacterized protein (DUF983 family)
MYIFACSEKSADSFAGCLVVVVVHLLPTAMVLLRTWTTLLRTWTTKMTWQSIYILLMYIYLHTKEKQEQKRKQSNGGDMYICM